MEFVPFTTEQLSYLAKQDAFLAPIYEGVFAADQLPGITVVWTICIDVFENESQG